MLSVVSSKHFSFVDLNKLHFNGLSGLMKVLLMYDWALSCSLQCWYVVNKNVFLPDRFYLCVICKIVSWCRDVSDLRRGNGVILDT